MPSRDEALEMPSNAVAHARDAAYVAFLTDDSGDSTVTFRGTISTPQPCSVLNPFVDAVHDHLSRKGRQLVTVDLTGLEFCNSSGFKSLIRWIDLILQQPEAAQYRLGFRSNPSRKWQRTSLLALTCFAPSRVEMA